MDVLKPSYVRVKHQMTRFQMSSVIKSMGLYNQLTIKSYPGGTIDEWADEYTRLVGPDIVTESQQVEILKQRVAAAKRDLESLGYVKQLYKDLTSEIKRLTA